MSRGDVGEATESLPFVDLHTIEVRARPEETWQGLLQVLSRIGADRLWQAVAAGLNCSPRRARGRPGVMGSTLPGFEIGQCEPPVSLRLQGRHRFSEYALRFSIEPLGENRSRLHAESRAHFPGAPGATYRLLVIGTRAHVLAMRGLLRRVERAAEAARLE